MTSGCSQSFSPLRALARKRFAAIVPRRGEIEIDRVAQLVDGSVEIRPLAADLHVSLVDPPAPRARPAPVPAQPLLDFGRVLLHPSVDGRVIDRHAAFCHHLLEIAIAYAVAAIPAHRPQHDLAPKVAPLEIRHGPASPRSSLPSRDAEGFAIEPSRIALARRGSEPRQGTRRQLQPPLRDWLSL